MSVSVCVYVSLCVYVCVLVFVCVCEHAHSSTCCMVWGSTWRPEDNFVELLLFFLLKWVLGINSESLGLYKHLDC